MSFGIVMAGKFDLPCFERLSVRESREENSDFSVPPEQIIAIAYPPIEADGSQSIPHVRRAAVTSPSQGRKRVSRSEPQIHKPSATEDVGIFSPYEK
jgi:hypothetical protein